jgi:hypothetical protein
MLLSCYYEHPCNPHSIVLDVKGCLGVFFMVFEVGLKLLVLLKALVFRLILRLHICEANWARLTSQHSLHSIHALWRVC